MDRPLPVAAALTELGLFNLDAPDRTFDDEVIWYRADFDESDAQDLEDGTLVFDGLATVAEVWLNGERVVSSHNMFRQWHVPLKGRLRAQGNQLLMRFDALNARLREPRKRPRWRVPMLEQRHQQLRWWRTTLLGRTPGWSPPAPVVGPWLPIWIARQASRAPEVLRQHVTVQGSTGRYQVVLAKDGLAGEATLHLRRGGLELSAAFNEAASAEAGARPHCVAEVSVPDAALWWPHTHGEPALYEAWIQWIDPQGQARRSESRHIGFRVIHIDRKDDGFAVQVNGVPVFCRGACWTPLNPLTLRADAADYDAAIRQLRNAGMNMVRIVGAMAWESTALFDACDRHGVLVWQDLMLANMDYPGDDPEFLEDLRVEISQQLGALQARPSLALVCGNSEVAQQSAMWGTMPELWEPALFHSTLPGWVAEHVDVDYWPSSASGGDFPHQPNRGTCSYYGVGAYKRSIDDARHSGLRFASECLAFANMPSDEALARLPSGHGARPCQPGWKSRVPRDLGAGWDFDDVRDHYVEHLFGERAQLVRATDPQRYLALGRAASAEAMSRSFAQWRASDSRCGGALVWFLRDLWAGAGWGLLDEQGKPKAAFHALSRQLQPIWVGWVDNGLNGLDLHWTNESASHLDVRIEVQAWRNGRQPVARGDLTRKLAPRGRGRVSLAEVLGGFVDLNWAYRFGPEVAELMQARLVDQDGTVLASALNFAPILLARRGPVGLAAREAIDAGSTQESDGSRRVLVSAQSAALGVHFEANGWLPSDEYFHLAPGEERMVTFVPNSAPSPRNTPFTEVTITALNTHEVLTL